MALGAQEEDEIQKKEGAKNDYLLVFFLVAYAHFLAYTALLYIIGHPLEGLELEYCISFFLTSFIKCYLMYMFTLPVLASTALSVLCMMHTLEHLTCCLARAVFIGFALR